MSGLPEVFGRLRPELRRYADESGRELFDLPDAPAPVADLPAPVRFLPAFDAPLLAYADRTRMMTDQVRRQVCVGAAVAATVLVDGTVAADLDAFPHRRCRHADRAAVAPAVVADRSAVEAEADRLLSFASPDDGQRQVRQLVHRDRGAGPVSASGSGRPRATTASVPGERN